jgi:hypothetical protein
MKQNLAKSDLRNSENYNILALILSINYLSSIYLIELRTRTESGLKWYVVALNRD